MSDSSLFMVLGHHAQSVTGGRVGNPRNTKANVKRHETFTKSCSPSSHQLANHQVGILKTFAIIFPLEMPCSITLEYSGRVALSTGRQLRSPGNLNLKA